MFTFQVPPWRESWSPRSRRQTVHVAGPTFDSQGNASPTSQSVHSSPTARRPRTASVTSVSPTPPARARRVNPSFGDYESLDRDDNYVIMDKSILKVHLPNGGFNVVKCGDATDVKVGVMSYLIVQFGNVNGGNPS